MTSPAKVLAKVVRAGLHRLGYVLWKREFLQYGISPFLDITRLSRAFECSIGTFFDVGANVGQTAREALDTFPDSNVFSFEPHPATFKRLTEAIRDPRLSAYQIAFTEQDGNMTLYEYASTGDGTQINSLVPDARFPTQFGYQATELVARCETIDGFCKKQGIERIDVLKVDTEGFELPVLKGAKETLLRDHPRIAGEAHPRFSDSAETILSYLGGLGYAGRAERDGKAQMFYAWKP